MTTAYQAHNPLVIGKLKAVSAGILAPLTHKNKSSLEFDVLKVKTATHFKFNYNKLLFKVCDGNTAERMNLLEFCGEYAK